MLVQALPWGAGRTGQAGEVPPRVPAVLDSRALISAPTSRALHTSDCHGLFLAMTLHLVPRGLSHLHYLWGASSPIY